MVRRSFTDSGEHDALPGVPLGDGVGNKDDQCVVPEVEEVTDLSSVMRVAMLRPSDIIEEW